MPLWIVPFSKAFWCKTSTCIGYEDWTCLHLGPGLRLGSILKCFNIYFADRHHLWTRIWGCGQEKDCGRASDVVQHVQAGKEDQQWNSQSGSWTRTRKPDERWRQIEVLWSKYHFNNDWSYSFTLFYMCFYQISACFLNSFYIHSLSFR